MEKPTMRELYGLRRLELTTQDRSRKSEAIIERLRDCVDWRHIRTVHVYQSLETLREVDTQKLFAVIQNMNSDIDIDIGISGKNAPFPIKQYDVLVVPLLAFDDNLNRLGFGGGWYDRFFTLQPQSLKIGLAYEFQQTAKIPTEAHDVPLDMVITESQIFTQ